MTDNAFKEAVDLINDKWPQHEIMQSIAEWIESWGTGTREDVYRTMETFSASSGVFPGVTFTHDVRNKLGTWMEEINEAIADYISEVGEHPTPPNGRPMTLEWLVWFALEWGMRRALYYLEHKWERYW